MTPSTPTTTPQTAPPDDENTDTCPYPADTQTGEPTVQPLSSEERATLVDCESVLETYRKTEIKAGHALEQIFQLQLYRETHRTFDDYCRDRWEFTADRAGQLRRGAVVVEKIAAAGVTELPTTEAQARHLNSALTDEQKVEAWETAVETKGSASAVTKKDVKAIAANIRGNTAPATVADLTASWSPEARRALNGTPSVHRVAVATFVNGLEQEITVELVAETVDGHNAAVVEDGLAEQPSLVGAAAEFVAAQSEYEDECVTDEPAGTAESPILDLDVLPDLDRAHADAQKRTVQFFGAAEKKPLLVSLSRAIAPPSLTDGLPDGVKEVIVELGELEQLGGPVRRVDGKLVLDLDEVRDAAREANVKKVLQRTNQNVDWARYTTNPLTGCWHQCRSVFCYAAGIARRLFAQGFVPTLYPARLDAFANTKPRDVSGLPHDEAWRERSVFAVSMGDLFGTWVPDYFVQAVLDEVGRHPEYFVFFLSKNPLGLARFTFPANCAVGVTLTGDDQGHKGSMDEATQRKIYAKYAVALGEVKGCAFTWISLEPFRAEVNDLTPFFEAGVRMVAVGGQSRTTLIDKDGKVLYSEAFQPELAWVESVRRQVRDAGVFLFEKENLLVRPKEIPFPAGSPGVPPSRRSPGARPSASNRPDLALPSVAARLASPTTATVD